MGDASDYGAFVKKLMGDSILLNLMLIPIATQAIYSNMIDRYFVESATSSVITTEAICRVVLTSNPQSSTGNMLVKSNMLAIEVFVPNMAPNMKDRVPNFERRSMQIMDRICILFNNQLINDRRMRLEGRHELISGSPGFCRLFAQYSFMKVYA